MNQDAFIAALLGTSVHSTGLIDYMCNHSHLLQVSKHNRSDMIAAFDELDEDVFVSDLNIVIRTSNIVTIAINTETKLVTKIELE